LAAPAPVAPPPEEAAAQPPGTVRAMADPLSQRELQILTLICKGLSNQEIGQQIFLSLSTVKWHNQNIFDKLDVQRRTEAVARARELKLL
jgi:LuxR family maltose regulon positive regulatory protein